MHQRLEDEMGMHVEKASCMCVARHEKEKRKWFDGGIGGGKFGGAEAS